MLNIYKIYDKIKKGTNRNNGPEGSPVYAFKELIFTMIYIFKKVKVKWPKWVITCLIFPPELRYALLPIIKPYMMVPYDLDPKVKVK